MKVGARYYDPQTGSFITRDTYLDQKPYLYCEHDPVNGVDPTGHDGETLEWEIGLARAVAENDVDGVGTLIESISDDETAKSIETVMREADLPKKMSTVERRLRGAKNVAREIERHAKMISEDPIEGGPRQHHLNEVKTFIEKIGRMLMQK